MKTKKNLILLMLNLIVLMMFSVSVYSEETKDEMKKDEPEIIFHGIGKIDSSADSDIIIDGKRFFFASPFDYMVFGDKKAIPDGFVKGTTVGYQLDENNNICSIWIIKSKNLDEAKKIMESQEAYRHRPLIPSN